MKNVRRSCCALGLVLPVAFGAAAFAQEDAGKEKAAGTEKEAKRSKALDDLLKKIQPEKEKSVEGSKDEIGVIETNLGTIKVKFFADVAPKAVENFKGLAKKGYYNGIIFHRVIDRFMIQGGDPKGVGTGGESIWGKPFEDEFDPKYRFDRKGLLAMANAGPKTNGSQFFITLVPTPHLNNRHTIFGEVISGMDVVEKIGKVKVGPGSKPLEPVTMKKVTIEVPAPKPPEAKAAAGKAEAKPAPKAEPKPGEKK